MNFDHNPPYDKAFEYYEAAPNQAVVYVSDEHGFFVRLGDTGEEWQSSGFNAESFHKLKLLEWEYDLVFVDHHKNFWRD